MKHPAFGLLGWKFASHQTVTHSKDEYVRRESTRVITTNGVEGFFSILKRGIYGVYQHVSEAHLQRYLTEFDFQYSDREKLGIDDTERASIAFEERGQSAPDLRNNSVQWALKRNDISAIASDIGTGTTSGNCGCHLKIEPLTAVLS